MHEDAASNCTLKGTGIGEGIVQGSAVVSFKADLEIPHFAIETDEVATEHEKLHQAIQKTKEQIRTIQKESKKKIAKKDASLFDAYLFLLEDKGLVESACNYCQEHLCNMAHAFGVVTDKLISQMNSVQDAYIRERYMDLKDVAQCVLRNLLKPESLKSKVQSEPYILVTNKLNISDMALFSQEKLLALLVEDSSQICHAVIMARSSGIPTIINLPDICQKIKEHDSLLLDVQDGLVYLNPDASVVEHCQRKKQERKQIERDLEKAIEGPVQMKDGTPVELWLTYDKLITTNELKALKLKGIGLVRTENFFLKQDALLDEEAQFQIYKQLVQSAAPYPVVLRTIDIGGDKVLDKIHLFDEEANPFLGLRAIRFCLKNKDFFKQQLRAILRASAFGHVLLLYPMITHSKELISINRVLEQCKMELREAKILFDPHLKVGIMLETPSAALTADLLADYCDFFSIGINDLTQYTLAVDRTNEHVSHLYKSMHPAIIRLLQSIVQAGQQKNKAVLLCGEMASNPMYIVMCLTLGLRSFCVYRDQLSYLQYLIQQCTCEELEKLFQQCFQFNYNEQNFKLFENFCAEKMNKIIK